MIRELLTEIIREPFTLTAIHGGDINEAFFVANDEKQFFVKYHEGSYALDMFTKERIGLNLIENAVPGFTPQVMSVIEKGNHACLVLEYIHSASVNERCQTALAQKLATLHHANADQYGLDHSNYIGSLIQWNDYQDSISEFWTYMRLEPQFKIARDSGYFSRDELPQPETIENVLEGVIPNEKPCLTHGDLWSGNYMCTHSGDAMIIDPAVAYVHREVDIAMTKLFGGFSASFYQTYNEIFPLQTGWERRIDIFQLYYLLAHLNLFGISYKGSVVRILNKWFN